MQAMAASTRRWASFAHWESTFVAEAGNKTVCQDGHGLAAVVGCTARRTRSGEPCRARPQQGMPGPQAKTRSAVSRQHPPRSTALPWLCSSVHRTPGDAGLPPLPPLLLPAGAPAPGMNAAAGEAGGVEAKQQGRLSRRSQALWGHPLSETAGEHPSCARPEQGLHHSSGETAGSCVAHPQSSPSWTPAGGPPPGGRA